MAAETRKGGEGMCEEESEKDRCKGPCRHTRQESLQHEGKNTPAKRAAHAKRVQGNLFFFFTFLAIVRRNHGRRW